MTKTEFNKYREITEEPAGAGLRELIYAQCREVYIQGKGTLDRLFEFLQSEGDLEKMVSFVGSLAGVVSTYQPENKQNIQTPAKEFSYKDFCSMKSQGKSYDEIVKTASESYGFDNRKVLRNYAMQFGKDEKVKRTPRNETIIRLS